MLVREPPSSSDKVPSARLRTTTRPDAVAATPQGSLPTARGGLAFRDPASMGVTESASGFTTHTVLPSGDIAIGLETVAAAFSRRCAAGSRLHPPRQASKPRAAYLEAMGKTFGVVRAS